MIDKKIIKPFLRWAGGKKWLLKYMDEILGNDFHYNNYHELFLGGASMFLNIKPTNEIFLSDLNSDLIETYICLRDTPEELIEKLSTFVNDATFYYKIRNKKLQDKVENAARFIYLNQTSFNGIYRVNNKGEYNVPYGYRSKDFLEAENLRNISLLLKNANLIYGDFENMLENIKEKDLVFLDPPYTVSHNNNGFIKYNQRLFSLEDQYKLSRFIDRIKEKNAYYILTNAAHPVIDEIFEKGDRKLELSRASLIGGKNATREKVKEYVFTNIEGR